MALGVAVSAAAMGSTQAKTDHAMGECQVTTAGANRAQIDPTSTAGIYMMEYISKSDPSFKKYAADGYSFREAGTKILVEPKYGELDFDRTNNSSISPATEGWYVYVADKGFSGNDTFIIQVEKYGVKVNIHYTVVAVDYTNDNGADYCEPEHWKISQIDAVGADGTALASTTVTPEKPFQPRHGSESEVSPRFP